MTSKQATVYVIDVGKSMGEVHNGRKDSDLEYAMTYVWDRILSDVAAGRKTLFQSVILARSDKSGETGYDNLVNAKPLNQLFMNDIRALQQHIKPSNTNEGDIASAIILAMMHIEAFCKKLQYIREIVVVTNGLGAIEQVSDNQGLDFSDAQRAAAKKSLRSETQQLIDNVSTKLADEKIKLRVLGIDFNVDGPDFQFEERDKPYAKGLNEAFLKEVTATAGGTYGNLAEAIAERERPIVKEIRPVTLYKGNLTLGQPNKEGTLSIGVERYPCIRQARPLTATTYAKTAEDGDGTQAPQEPPSSMPVSHRKTYRVEDHTQKTGWRDVDGGNLARGYEYGRTVVPFEQEDDDFTKFSTVVAFEIVGLVMKEKCHRFQYLSDTAYTVAARGDHQAKMALSALIHSLNEDKSCAIARLVTKEGRAPVMVLLSPHITKSFECLIDVNLPFAEDVRQYGFAPLDKVVTATGKVLKEHRNLPNEDLKKAMSDFVDSMDLPGLPQPTTEMYNPTIHHINSTIKHRAIYPDRPLPKPSPLLIAPSKMHPDLVKASAKTLKTLITKADVKVVPPVAKHKRERNIEKPLSGLDMSALLAKGSKDQGKGEKAQIDKKNPVPSFKRLLDTTTDPNGITDLSKQMMTIIESMVRDSFGDNEYRHVLLCLRTLREELIDLEEPELWNELVRGFKGKVLSDKLGGDRDEVWWLVRRDKLGLVEGQGTGVREDEAKLFYRR